MLWYKEEKVKKGVLYINSRANRQGTSGGPANSRKQYASGQCRDRQYFLKNHPINLTQVYQNQYNTRLCDDQEDFNIQLNKNVTAKLPFIDSYTKYIKGALVITPQDIKKKSQY